MLNLNYTTHRGNIDALGNNYTYLLCVKEFMIITISLFCGLSRHFVKQFYVITVCCVVMLVM